MNHLSPGQIVDLARGLLAENDDPRPHLDGCDHCRRAVDRLRPVRSAASAAAAVPEAAVRQAKALAAALSAPNPLSTFARLMLDTLALVPAGVRGSAHYRLLLFEADPWVVDLRLARSERTLSITGQLAHNLAPAQGCAGMPVLARSADAVIGRDRTGSWGEFTITCADVTPLSLEIRVQSATITLALPDRT